MKRSILKEFRPLRPRAIVLDDNAGARLMTARHLRRRGFEVTECATVASFLKTWRPGTADVIVADWQLSKRPDAQHGDHVLQDVRSRDWDVPFVLVSGQLADTGDREQVLSRLLESGSARFVVRGSAQGSIGRVGDEAEALIERRDLGLLKIVLSLRAGALRGDTISTSSGEKKVSDLLEDLVSGPAASHEAGRPLAKARARRATSADT